MSVDAVERTAKFGEVEAGAVGVGVGVSWGR